MRRLKLLVIDGHSIIHRAFYGIKLLSTKDGRYTNAVHGFLTILLKLGAEVSPDAVAVAFDVKGPTFRHGLYGEYKAHRKPMPPELAEQIPVIKQLLQALGYPIVECPGYEADDILGTLAKSCEAAGNDCVLATGDRDSLQLISPKVTVLLASTSMGRPLTKHYSEKNILDEYGVTPAQLIEIKALMGDSSDNIPGIAGIGPKTAGELINRFGTLEALYSQLDESDLKASLKEKLAAGRPSAELSRVLGTIVTDAPVDTDINRYIPGPPDAFLVTRIMTDLELFKLLEKIGMRPLPPPPASGEADAPRPLALREAEDLFALLEKLGSLGSAYFLSVFEDGSIREMYFVFDEAVTVARALNADFPVFFRAFAQNPGIKKHTFDIKLFCLACEREGIRPAGAADDVMLAGYLLNPSAKDYAIERLATLYGLPAPLLQEENGDALLAARLPALCSRLRAEIEGRGQTRLLDEVELPLAGVLAGMEYEGFAVDIDGLERFGREIGAQAADITQQIYQAAGFEFNINSPKQLGEVLFEKLGLSTGKKNKTGYSTGAEVLEQLRGEHPVIDGVLQYRTLSKLKSTYCDGLIGEIGPDGRIHTTFRQTETRTGRISSIEPNLQNIPIRSDLGRELRRFFIAGEGKLLVDADYSQIELRVLAHISGDETMIEAFNNNIDIHTVTASQVFNIPLDMVTPLMRNRAKAVNFGIVYGIGAFSLAKDIGVSRKEADTYIKEYLSHYKGVADYMKRVVSQAKENGYVETLFGRRRYLPELSSSNAGLRAFGERVALNMPIQGTAADLIKIAMVRVHQGLTAADMKAKLILQVHDELIVEAPQQEREQAETLVRREMENAFAMRVKLSADVHAGKTWYEAKG